MNNRSVLHGVDFCSLSFPNIQAVITKIGKSAEIEFFKLWSWNIEIFTKKLFGIFLVKYLKGNFVLCIYERIKLCRIFGILCKNFKQWFGHFFAFSNHIGNCIKSRAECVHTFFFTVKIKFVICNDIFKYLFTLQDNFGRLIGCSRYIRWIKRYGKKLTCRGHTGICHKCFKVIVCGKIVTEFNFVHCKHL